MKLALPLFILFLIFINVGIAQQKNTYNSFEDIAINAQNFAEKEQYLQAALELEKINPNDSLYNDVLTTISYYYLLAEDNQKCIDFCNLGIKNALFSSPYSFYVNKIAALSRLEKNKEAIEVATEALKRYPKSHTLYFNRAISYEETGEIKKAVQDLEQSIQINPYYIKSHLRLANLFAKQNQTAQALMCLNVYLMLSPDGKYSSKILNLANKIASRRDPYNVDKKISISKDDDDFEELNLILNNKIALNKKYKTKNKIRSSFAIQSHVLIEQLKEYETKGGFMNDKYVQFFKWISEKNYYNVMIYTTHYDSEYDKYKAIAKKNSTTVKNFVPEVYIKWSDVVGQYKEEKDGKEFTRYYLYEDLQLLGIGEIKEDKINGLWEFYTEDGALSTRGSFKDGERTGEWNSYTEDGELERKLSYEDGKLNGSYTTYKKGIKQHQSNYDLGKANGLIINYYPTGATKNKMEYKDDLLEGKYEVYFKNGISINLALIVI